MSDEKGVAEEIWVNVAEGAEKTGFHPDHVRRLARENSRLPEDERFLHIRKTSREYTIWLPDLLSYSRSGLNSREAEKIWVNTTEGAEITGYTQQYLMKLAQKISQQPEEKREIQIRRRRGYELWLPDLVAYIERSRGPYAKRNPKA